MRFFLAALVLLQDPDADLQGRLASILDRAGDLDPAVREEAGEDAVRLCRDREDAIAALARQKRPAAMAALALAGKLDGAALFRTGDRGARRAACDLVTPTKELVPELLRMIEGRDLASRIAAARALGRIDDPALRQSVSSALGHGMRRAGSEDLFFGLIAASWRGAATPQQFLPGDAEAERTSIAVAVLINLPGLALTEAFAPSLVRVLDNDRIDRDLRSMLIRCLGRRSPSAFVPVLTVRDRKVRAEIVDVLDRALADPLDAPAIHAAWRDARDRKLDDGKTPPQPLTARLEGWLKRLCGDTVTPETFPDWVRTSYRSHVDRHADAAIVRGVAGLQRAYERDPAGKLQSGGPVAAAALTTTALLKCDRAPDDPTVARALDVLLDRDPEGVYGASVAAMALATAIEKGAPRRERLERRLRRMAELLVDAQLASGGWSYGLQSLEGWRYDLSNTQFALVGLRAAANGGAKVPRTTWERAQSLLEKVQMPDGGWSYQGRVDSSYDRMTAAGAYSWILCRISLDDQIAPEQAAGLERARSAIQWLANAADARPYAGQPDYYLLWSLERLCMVSKADRLGTRDWYAEGAAILVRAQTRDGVWGGGTSPLVDTSLALLFLRKAYVARPEVATEPARRVSEETAREVLERHVEALVGERVREMRVETDRAGAFIRIVATSEADATALAAELGRALDGVPLRIAVE